MKIENNTDRKIVVLGKHLMPEQQMTIKSKSLKGFNGFIIKMYLLRGIIKKV